MINKKQMATEALALLRDIDSGKEKVFYVHESWDSAWCGNVEFRTASGWTIVVFNDCDEWDYIHSITHPSGTEIDYDELSNYPELNEYRPTDEAVWSQASKWVPQ